MAYLDAELSKKATVPAEIATERTPDGGQGQRSGQEIGVVVYAHLGARLQQSWIDANADLLQGAPPKDAFRAEHLERMPHP